MTPTEFSRALKTLAFKDTFNPYVHRCPAYDYARAPGHRTGRLLAMLQAAADTEVNAIWIGRDYGWRGGRRTGLAFTDDVHVCEHCSRWGVNTGAGRVTKGSEVAERAAAAVWRILSRIDENIFLWNVLPLHPHQSNDPFSNRRHTAAERRAGEEVLDHLVRLLNPRRLVAVGNDAAAAADRLAGNLEVIKVRHPSHGGERQFASQMHRLYGLH